MPYFFLTRNNCCEFLASYGVILQRDIQPSNQRRILTFYCTCLKLYKNVTDLIYNRKRDNREGKQYAGYQCLYSNIILFYLQCNNREDKQYAGYQCLDSNTFFFSFLLTI